MATEQIYTVSSQDDCDRSWEHLVIGSYRTMARALDECVDYIMERINIRDDIARAVANDENHPTAGGFMEETDEGWAVIDPIALRDYIRDELGGERCYYVLCGNDSYHFDIDENDIED